jgi:RNA polymerase sigma-70 factor (ECF subfamily)
VLILRDVLRWQATEAAELLDTSVASVNSALQRARSSLEKSELSAESSLEPIDAEQRELLDRYVEAFERYDVDALVRLLREDATLSMPPFTLWLQGTEDIAAWLLGRGSGCRGSRLIPVDANGSPAFGQYRPSATGSGHEPWALQVIDFSGGRVQRINAFLDTERFFPLFGLPPRLDP